MRERAAAASVALQGAWSWVVVVTRGICSVVANYFGGVREFPGAVLEIEPAGGTEQVRMCARVHLACSCVHMRV
jgi:hypothetical protein